MAPKDLVWPLDDHTRGKHEVLRHYLEAWFPIVGASARRVAFIDGFAGPGEYAGGEPGSPLIAIDAFRKHALRVQTEGVFLFIEKDPARADHLRALLSRQTLPPNCKTEVVTGEFEQRMTAVLDSIPAGLQLAPAFVMLDPFGIKGVPMALVKRLLESEKAEIYISFMYEPIDRFKSTPEFEVRLTELYGTDDWRNGLVLEGEAKKEFLFRLFDSRLRAAGAKQVIRFDLYEKRRLVYAIFFATKHWKGAEVMKRAIWKVAPFRDFAFRGAHYGQLAIDFVDYGPLRGLLQERFKGKGWVSVEDIEEFVGSDRTDYHIARLKKDVLVPLEKDGLIEADTKTRKKARTFPPRTMIRFIG